jgi:hypothetical protein
MTSTAIIYGPGNDRQAVPSFLSFLPTIYMPILLHMFSQQFSLAPVSSVRLSV